MVNFIFKNVSLALKKKWNYYLIWTAVYDSDWQIKRAEISQGHFSWLYIFSYIWRHLDIGYVQGMCDLLAPLLVILDDGESTLWITSYLPSSLTFGVFLQLLTKQQRRVCPLTFLLRLPCFLLSEALAFSCFTELMKRMNQNFPHGGAMDTHFANMRSLIQVTQHQSVHTL